MGRNRRSSFENSAPFPPINIPLLYLGVLMKMAAASSVYPDQEATKSRISCSKAASLYRLKLAPPDLQQTQEREMLLSQLGQIQPCSYLGTKLEGSVGAHRHILGLVSTLLGIPHRLCCSSLSPHCVPMKRLVGQHRRATQSQTKDVTVGRAIPGGVSPTNNSLMRYGCREVYLPFEHSSCKVSPRPHENDPDLWLPETT